MADVAVQWSGAAACASAGSRLGSLGRRRLAADPLLLLGTPVALSACRTSRPAWRPGHNIPAFLLVGLLSVAILVPMLGAGRAPPIVVYRPGDR